jgi:ApbE superfamily uncharacterized protein (UPF0280 family)
LSQLRTDRQACVTDLANEIRLTRQQLYDLVLAQPQFAEAVLEFRRGAKPLDAHGHAGFDPR